MSDDIERLRDWARAVEKAGPHPAIEESGHPRDWCPTCETVALLAEAIDSITAERSRAEKAEADLAVRDELLELAWGLIANANEGDWVLTDAKWHAAAIDWRENWHRLLTEDNQT